MTFDWLAILVLMTIGCTLQASVGIGAGLFAAPLLGLLAPQLLPGPMLASVFLLTALITVRDHRSLDVRGASWALLGRFPGIGIGASIVTLTTRAWVDLALGGMILTCVLLSVARWKLEPSRGNLLAAGLVSGITGTAAGVGGPPVALVLQRAAGDRLRATMSGYFVVGTAASLSVLAAFGRFGAAEMLDTVRLAPAVAVGFVLSFGLTPLLDRGYTRPAVLLISGSASGALLVRGLLHLF